MPISDVTVQEFQMAWQKAHRVHLNVQDAREVLEGLVQYFDQLAQIDSNYDEP